MTDHHTSLACVLEAEPVRLEPLADHHIEGLRTACAQDQNIWDIYPVNMLDDGFDRAIRQFRQQESWVRFAVIDTRTGTVAGMSIYINPDRSGVVEIGGTYVTPSLRGTGFNAVMKTLLINHAFSHGFRRIEFRVDTRNTRSMAAVEKLGAVREGTLRKHRITWTGYVRDTAIFGLLQDEWNAPPKEL